MRRVRAGWEMTLVRTIVSRNGFLVVTYEQLSFYGVGLGGPKTIKWC